MIDTYWKRTIPPLLVSMMAGIVAGVHFPGAGAFCLALVAICGGVLIHRLTRRHSSRGLPLLLFFGIGYLAILPWSAPEFPRHHIVHRADGNPYDINGIITTEPLTTPRRTKFVLQAESIYHNDNWRDASGNIRVTLADHAETLRKGDRVRIKGRMRRPSNFNNPGGFNYQRYLAFQKVWVTTFVNARGLEIVSRCTEQGLGAVVRKARRNIAAVIEKSANDAAAQVLKALVVGERHEIPRQVRDEFSRAGVSHLLAISGLHVGIVGTLCFFIFRWLLSYWTLLLQHALVRKLAAVLTLFPVLFYGLITGMSPSTQRAVIMVSVFLLSILIQREQDLINTLSAAALVILVVHPPSLYSISFQLSFTAVLGIVHALPKIWPQPASGPRYLKKLLSFMGVSLVALLSTLPLGMYYFNQASVIGVVSNLVAVPLIGFIVVPLGLVILLLGLALPQWAGFGVAPARWILEFCMDIISYFAQLPFAAFKTITPSVFEIVCYYLLAWAVLNMRKRMPPPNEDGAHHPVPAAGSWNPRLGKVARVVLLIAGVAVMADISFWIHERLLRRDLRVTFIDVGQGGATLVEAPYGRVFLVDGGGFGDNSTFDVGERIVAPLLWRKKIATVDTLVLSHPNSDHLSGLLYIARHFNVRQVWSNDDVSSISSYAEFNRILASQNISKPDFKKLARDQTLDGLRVEIQHPAPDYLPIRDRDFRDELNDNSLVLKLTLGNVSFLLPGDIEFEAEEQLVASGRETLQSSVLLAPHHGSKTSSSRVFLEAVAPRVVVASCGRPGRFQFPHADVLKRYTQMGFQVLTTYRNGAITMVTDGNDLKIKSFR
jgi:competence protein ComEC